MSSNLYLNSIIKIARGVQIFSPSIASFLVSAIWLTPKRKRVKWPNEVEQFEVITKHGKVKVYKYGQGAPVWLIHDWSGAGSDYWRMMQRFAENGISTVTFDLPGHGNTPINKVTLQAIIEVFDELSLIMMPPSHVICQGASAYFLMHSHWFKEYQNKLTLISPCFSLIDTLKSIADNYGISHQVLESSFKYLFSREKQHNSKMRTFSQIERFKGKLSIYYDHNSPVDLTQQEQILQQAGHELIVTNNYNNDALLKSRKVFESLSNTEELETNMYLSRIRKAV